MANRPHSQKYSCSMHPEVIKDAPGQCPKCGMELIPVKKSKEESHSSHQGHSGPSKKNFHDHAMNKHDQAGGHSHYPGMIDDFKKRFYIVLILTIPIMALSPMIQHWVEMDWSFQGSPYVLPFIVFHCLFLWRLAISPGISK